MAECVPCAARVKHIHGRTYRDPVGHDHFINDTGVCITCGRPHPRPYTAEDNRHWVRGTWWRRHPADAAVVLLVCASIETGLRKVT